MTELAALATPTDRQEQTCGAHVEVLPVESNLRLARVVKGTKPSTHGALVVQFAWIWIPWLAFHSGDGGPSLFAYLWFIWKSATHGLALSLLASRRRICGINI